MFVGVHVCVIHMQYYACVLIAGGGAEMSGCGMFVGVHV